MTDSRPRRNGAWPGRELLRDARGTLASLGATGRRVHSPSPEPPTRAHFDGRRFRNTDVDARWTPRVAASLVRRLARQRSSGNPPGAIPVERPDLPGAAQQLAATWLGHATVLLEIDGYRVLADPMFSDRASPSALVGPRRLHPPPLTVPDLPAVDAVLISHDHYDHLDRDTVTALTATSAAPFLVPLGIGAHLRGWGVPADRVVELDWDAEHRLGALSLTCTEARHFSGRGPVRNRTLWSSWAIAGPTRRVFFGGDTGYTAAFIEIGHRHGPFDLAVLPIGAYDAAWPDIHLTPEQALRAHRDLTGSVLLPIHWATFNLAPHGWADPIERLLRAAGDRGDAIACPRPGRRITLDQLPEREFWWRTASPASHAAPGGDPRADGAD